ncbi:MAG: cytochrome c biogenesis protein CcsA [Phycisphaerales bacterium]|jgi:cytochrome c-type biogenesis protein CcsB|nr:cytochrome c biogenesis protein CcsA [Phycisphaerales bacterium]
MIRLILLCVTTLSIQVFAAAPVVEAASAPNFYDAIDLSPLDEVTIWQDGRLKSFESFSRETMNWISGPLHPGGLTPRVAMMDIMLRPQVWIDQDLYFVKNKLIRVEIARALRDSTTRPLAASDERLDRFLDKGLAPRGFLTNSDVRSMLSRMRTDVMRFARPVQAIDTALMVANPEVIREELLLVPPVGADATKKPWTRIGLLVEEDPTSPVAAAWINLQSAWIAGDVDGVSQSAAALATTLRSVNPDVYPSADRLRTESMYFQWRGFTWGWIFYVLAVAVLLMWVVYRWRGAFWGGLLLFLFAFGIHTTSVILRTYISGRWPNTNMFEAVTTSAWYGGVFAIIMEIIVRRTRMSGLFVLGSAICSMVALMAAHLDPVHLNPAIGNKMPVLHDLWLHIHTNVIIFSYVLIFIAAMTAGLFLIRRLMQSLFGTVDASSDFAKAGGAGFLMAPRPDGTTSLTAETTSFGQVLDGATMVLVELSFILLWAGLVMGAIWADHSWGRPWGWDPKETFALNTFIIFVLLIHVRMKVKDKALWTAWLALIGAIVMIFNWIIINFTISGLHSYA